MNELRREIIEHLSKFLREDPSAEDPVVTLLDREDIVLSNVKEQRVFLIEGLSKLGNQENGRKYPDHYYNLSKSAQNRFRKRNRGKY